MGEGDSTSDHRDHFDITHCNTLSTGPTRVSTGDVVEGKDQAERVDGSEKHKNKIARSEEEEDPTNEHGMKKKKKKKKKPRVVGGDHRILITNKGGEVKSNRVGGGPIAKSW